jgi:hypothetical protein
LSLAVGALQPNQSVKSVKRTVEIVDNFIEFDDKLEYKVMW